MSILTITSRETVLFDCIARLESELTKVTLSRDIYQQVADAQAASHKVERDGLAAEVAALRDALNYDNSLKKL